MKNILLLLNLSLFTFSCEKIIDLPLNETAQKVVIEAVTSNFVGQSYVLLSRTATIYGENTFQKINDATVTITDKNGVTTTFIEDGNGVGRYIHPTFITDENNSYDLSVIADGITYTATSSTQSFITIGTLFSIREENTGFGNGNSDSVDIVYMGYHDPVDEVNHYRFNVYTNGEKGNRLFIGDDKFINGQTPTAPIFQSFNPSDTVFVELIEIDKANYTYLYSKANVSDSGPLSATPANPVTNIEGGALGYFGAYLVDTMTVIIPN